MKSLDMEQPAIWEYVDEGVLVARNADTQGILEAKMTELKNLKQHGISKSLFTIF